MTNSQPPQTELAACPTPFCAVPEVYIRRLGGTCRVECKYCGVRTEVFGNEATAIEQWNTRPSPLVDTGEALRGALERIRDFRPSEQEDRPPHTQIAIFACQTARAALAAHPKPEESA